MLYPFFMRGCDMFSKGYLHNVNKHMPAQNTFVSTTLCRTIGANHFSLHGNGSAAFFNQRKGMNSCWTAKFVGWSGFSVEPSRSALYSLDPCRLGSLAMLAASLLPGLDQGQTPRKNRNGGKGEASCFHFSSSMLFCYTSDYVPLLTISHTENSSSFEGQAC